MQPPRIKTYETCVHAIQCASRPKGRATAHKGGAGATPRRAPWRGRPAPTRPTKSPPQCPSGPRDDSSRQSWETTGGFQGCTIISHTPTIYPGQDVGLPAAAMLRRIAEIPRFAHLVPFLHVMPACPSDIFVGHLFERLFPGALRGDSSEGAVQGRALSGLLFALGIHPELKALNSELEPFGGFGKHEWTTPILPLHRERCRRREGLGLGAPAPARRPFRAGRASA